MLGLFAYIVPLIKAQIETDKKALAADVVRAAYSIMANLDEQVAKGELSQDEAQELAKNTIGKMRFGVDNSGYLWINDLQPRMIMHPFKPALNGTDLSGLRDPGGKLLFVEMTKVCNESGEGLVYYKWPKPGFDRPVSKLSFVKLYKPWGWIIGSGIYIDDMMSMARRTLGSIGILLIIVAMVVTASTFIVGGFISRPVREYGEMMQRFTRALTTGEGNLKSRLDIKSKDEIGILAMDINKVLDAYARMVEYMMNALDMTVALDKEGVIVYKSPSCERILGYAADELLGKNLFDFIDRDELAIIGKAMKRVLESHDALWSTEIRILHKNGTWRLLEAVVRAVATGSSEAFIMNARDITGRKKAETALEKLRHRNELILNSAGEGILGVDSKGIHTFVNPSAAKMLGYEIGELIGKHSHLLWHNTAAGSSFRATKECPMCSVLSDGIVHHMRGGAFRRKDGTSFPVLYTSNCIVDGGEVIGAVVTFRDVTEQKKAELEQEKLRSQLLQSQKMEAVGQLAGGIAHDFNNMLTAIIGYGHVLKMKMNENEPLKIYADRILASSEKAANLTQSLLAFSRKQTSNPKPVNLNEIIREVDKLFLRVISEDVEMHITLANEDLIVMADTGQIEQVLINLVTNARDAMPSGGTLTIESSRVEMDDIYLNTHHYGKLGQYAVISITDAGIGMDQKTRERVFEPFFTTKEPGRGTGLGLAMVYGIIKQHEGYINVYSEPLIGTTFKIYLPLAKFKVEAIKTEVMSPPERGTETILLAEDDKDVRLYTKEVLEDFGYEVIEATDGTDAIEKFMEHRDKIHLVILDVIMPKMNGKEAYDNIQRIIPL